MKYGIPDNQISKAMTVIAVTTKDGKALGVGIRKNEKLMWAPKGTTGYNTNFEKIQIIDKGSSNSGFPDGKNFVSLDVFLRKHFIRSTNSSLFVHFVNSPWLTFDVY